VTHTLQRLELRWAGNLESEVGFWHALLDPNSDVEEDSAASARNWLKTGEVHWAWDDMCEFLQRTRVSSRSQRILNAGSGPLAPPWLQCDHGEVAVVAVDGLARFYARVFDILEHQPHRLPVHCPVESLRHCFPLQHADVVHMRNALDHATDPLLGIKMMLEVTKPGGWVLLRHARNEGVAGQFQFGLHQWAFDVQAGPDGQARFVIWNPVLRCDVSAWLLAGGHAAEVHVQLRPHPGGAEDEPYVYVDIQKPL